MRELGVAFGKIAGDPHVPAIAATPGLTLVADAFLLGSGRIVEPLED